VADVETCCVVDGLCDSPANLESPRACRARCFACGEAVCLRCSSRRRYHGYGRQRLCNNCQRDLDGNNHVVARRQFRLAGYRGSPPDYLLDPVDAGNQVRKSTGLA
jgi:hypothetical protein